jgi:hypothetical protein
MVLARQHFKLAEVEVAKSSDFSVTYRLITHLGGILSVGDTVMGYALRTANLSSDVDLSELRFAAPDVILVKKAIDREKKKEKRRLQRLARSGSSGDRGRGGRGGRASAATSVAGEDEDFEQFAAELAEDPEMQALLVAQEAHAGHEEEPVGEGGEEAALGEAGGHAELGHDEEDGAEGLARGMPGLGLAKPESTQAHPDADLGFWREGLPAEAGQKEAQAVDDPEGDRA